MAPILRSFVGFLAGRGAVEHEIAARKGTPPDATPVGSYVQIKVDIPNPTAEPGWTDEMDHYKGSIGLVVGGRSGDNAAICVVVCSAGSELVESYMFAPSWIEPVRSDDVPTVTRCQLMLAEEFKFNDLIKGVFKFKTSSLASSVFRSGSIVMSQRGTVGVVGFKTEEGSEKVTVFWLFPTGTVESVEPSELTAITYMEMLSMPQESRDRVLATYGLVRHKFLREMVKTPSCITVDKIATTGIYAQPVAESSATEERVHKRSKKQK